MYQNRIKEFLILLFFLSFFRRALWIFDAILFLSFRSKIEKQFLKWCLCSSDIREFDLGNVERWREVCVNIHWEFFPSHTHTKLCYDAINHWIKYVQLKIILNQLCCFPWHYARRSEWTSLLCCNVTENCCNCKWNDLLNWTPITHSFKHSFIAPFNEHNLWFLRFTKMYKVANWAC